MGSKWGGEENGQWVLLLDWASVADERAASVAMMQSAETTAFKQVVDPKTVSKRLLELCSLA